MHGPRCYSERTYRAYELNKYRCMQVHGHLSDSLTLLHIYIENTDFRFV